MRINCYLTADMSFLIMCESERSAHHLFCFSTEKEKVSDDSGERDSCHC